MIFGKATNIKRNFTYIVEAYITGYKLQLRDGLNLFWSKTEAREKHACSKQRTAAYLVLLAFPSVFVYKYVHVFRKKMV